jgi:hypothetical protein
MQSNMINDKRFNLAGMRFLLFILIILVSHGTFAQVFIKPNNSWGIEYNRIKLDSAAVIPSDTTLNKIVGSIAVLNGTFYIKNIFSWDALATGGSGSGGALTWENVLDNGSDFSHSHLSNGNTNDLYFNNYGIITFNATQVAIPYLANGDINNQWITTDGAGNFLLKALPIPVDTSGQFFGNQDLQNTIDYGNRLRHANTIHAVGYDFYIDSLANHSTFSGKTATFDNQTGAYTEIHQDSANAYLYAQNSSNIEGSEVRAHPDSTHMQAWDSLGHNTYFTLFKKGTTRTFASVADTIDAPVINLAQFHNSDPSKVLAPDENGNVGLVTVALPENGTGTMYTVKDSTCTIPGSPATDDAYMVCGSPTGAWAGHALDIATWNGSSWDFTDAVAGDYAETTDDFITYIFRAGNWVRTSSLPLLVNGNKLGANLNAGTIDNRAFFLKTNNIQRLQIANTGAFTFNSLSGTGTVLMGLSSTGLASRITLGTNLSLSGSTLNASGSGSALLPTTGNGTATGNVTGDATGFNVTLRHPDTLTLSAASKAILEGINGLNLISNDTINEVSANYLLDKGVTANYLASTTANFGYTSGTSVTLGITATSSALTGVGIPAFSSGTIKSLVEDQSTHAITQKTLDRNTDLTGTLTVSNGGTGLGTLTAYAILAGGTTSTGNLQQVSGVGTSGQVLTSAGAGALPTWQTPSSGSSLTATQIGFGDGSNALTGSANLTYAGSAVTVTNTSLGSATTPTLKLVNSTAAISGGQQSSPAIYLEGQGWKTTATAGSQSAAWAINNVPVQGTGSPTENLTFWSNINGGGYNSRATLSDGGNFTATTLTATGSVVAPFVQTPLILTASSATALVLRMGGFVVQNIYGGTANVLIQNQTSGAFPTDPGVTFSVYENTTGGGTGVSNTAGGTTVTGVGTHFLNDFKIGDAITITTNGTVETETITAIASNLSITTATWTNAHTAGAAYTLTGGNRFAVMASGLIGIGTATPAAFLDIQAGNANFPQLLLHSSTLLTTPVNGAVEYDGTHMYITIGGVRKQLDN